MIADLRALWQEAFQDPKDFTDLFFAKGFSPEWHHHIAENGRPVSALYWFDCSMQGRKLAYIYAVATLKSHHGKGLAGQLLEETHAILKSRGYDGAILVPAKESLFAFYQKFGYKTAATVTMLSCRAGDSPAPIREISPEEYAKLRPAYLPDGSVALGTAGLAFLHGYCRFYAGEDFLLIFQEQEGALCAQELLGNTAAAPGILRALGFAKGCFRCPGTDRDFAMWLSFREDCPAPTYFATALD